MSYRTRHGGPADIGRFGLAAASSAVAIALGNRRGKIQLRRFSTDGYISKWG